MSTPPPVFGSTSQPTGWQTGGGATLKNFVYENNLKFLVKND